MLMGDDEITDIDGQTTEGYSHRQAVDALASAARRGAAVRITVARAPLLMTAAEMDRVDSPLVDEEETLVYFSDEEEV